MDLPDTEAPGPQWGDGFEIESLINVRVAASGMRIAEVSSYECDRIHGASNLNAGKDGLRILWTILQEFQRARRRGWKRGARIEDERVTAASRYLLDQSLSDVRPA
jgi:hypothetical protein